MRKLEFAVEGAVRYFVNKVSGKPLYVSLEVTEMCNADCDFCRYRRSNDGDGRVTKELDSYLKQIRFLNPVVLGISGGEPLLRKDLERLVEEAKRKANVPYVTVTTNGSLLTAGRYFSLSDAGLDKLSISLDFAGSRHDEERRLPGPYQKIRDFLEAIEGEKGAKVMLNVIYMRDNLSEIQRIISLAENLSAQVAFLPYNPIKNGNYSHAVAGADGSFGSLIRPNADAIVTSRLITANTEKYLKTGAFGRCDAGRSFLFVLPNGMLRACLERPESEGATLQEVRAFKEVNSCNRCYSSCRAYPEMAANPFNAIRMALEMKEKL